MKNKVWLLAILLIFGISIPAHANTCAKNVISAAFTSGTTQVIAAPTNGQYIHICAIFTQVVQGSGAADFGFVAGTGVNCASTVTFISPQWSGVASSVQGYTVQLPSDTTIDVPANNALCFRVSATPTNSQVQLLYYISSR